MVEETRRIPRRKGKADMKVRTIKHAKGSLEVRPRRIVKKDITKEEFLANLEKFAHPASKPSESDLEKSGT